MENFSTARGMLCLIVATVVIQLLITTRNSVLVCIHDIDSSSLKVASSESKNQKWQGNHTFDPLVSLLKDQTSDPWKQELYARLDLVREKCGSLCSVNDLKAYTAKGSHQPGRTYSTFTAPVDCKILFEMEEIDVGDTSVPYPIPDELKKFYSLDGAIKIQHLKRFQNVYLGGQALKNIWSREEIERDLDLLARGALEGTYGKVTTTYVRDAVQKNGGLNGKIVLVVGSEMPWLETIALGAGASNVTTLEYGAIESHHPQISTLTPSDFRKKFVEGTLPKYDAVLSFSSLEHPGLGRYGDALNPWADILSLARCWCTTKEQGTLMLAVPCGADITAFNAHRVYGNIRMPLLTTNWIPTDGTKDFESCQDFQPLRFFRKASLV